MDNRDFPKMTGYGQEDITDTTETQDFSQAFAEIRESRSLACELAQTGGIDLPSYALMTAKKLKE
jgi:hypothetical protein